MLRDTLIDLAIRCRVDEPLRNIRAVLLSNYRHDRIESEHMRALLKSVLKADSNCIDIGAYRGRMLAELVRAAPQGKHIAYEPLPHLYRNLMKLFPSLDIRQAAVSNKVGETTFSYVRKVPAESGFREKNYAGTHQVEKLTVRTESLDRCLPAGYVPALIKIDVEGAERQVFEGAIETITRYKPVIIFEHGKGSATYYDTRPRHIFELLHDEAGLCIYDLDGNGPYSLSQLEDAFTRDERWDYVARP